MAYVVRVSDICHLNTNKRNKLKHDHEQDAPWTNKYENSKHDKSFVSTLAVLDRTETGCSEIS